MQTAATALQTAFTNLSNAQQAVATAQTNLQTGQNNAALISQARADVSVSNGTQLYLTWTKFNASKTLQLNAGAIQQYQTGIQFNNIPTDGSGKHIFTVADLQADGYFKLKNTYNNADRYLGTGQNSGQHYRWNVLTNDFMDETVNGTTSLFTFKTLLFSNTAGQMYYTHVLLAKFTHTSDVIWFGTSASNSLWPVYSERRNLTTIGNDIVSTSNITPHA